MSSAARKLNRPVVFDYENFRSYLGDMYEYHKNVTAGFSYRTFSMSAGFKSPNFLKLLIDGQRKMSMDSIRKVIKAFRLNADEGIFFKNLVLANQAETTHERGGHLEMLYRSKVFRELHPLKPAQFEYYSKWYHIPIRELIASPDFKEDEKWIQNRLRNRVSKTQVREAIQNLLDLGLVRRDEVGRLCQVQANVTTGHEAASAAVAEFHRQMMSLASESIDSVPRHKREISGSTVLISEESFGRLKEMVQEFRRTLLAETESAKSDGKKVVYQLSFQLFPLTQKADTEES
jgi:uncharacterized protein (TIGR02147 family)